jgi:TetR/AcrR family transcriptional repressor of nem operon
MTKSAKNRIGAALQEGSRATAYASTRDVLIRCGMELLTEQGFSATGLDAVLRRATVPKGSFYHYFGSKTEFGQEVMKAYDAYFLHKLDRCLLNESRNPMDRLIDFVADAKIGLARYRYTRGCLVGNLSQELGALPSTYRKQLDGILMGWQRRVAQCLRLAQKQGAIGRKADCDTLAEFFWIGWEGAVMRARLVQNASPLDTFVDGFLKGLPR